VPTKENGNLKCEIFSDHNCIFVGGCGRFSSQNVTKVEFLFAGDNNIHINW
jgi:hypothetical protein